MAKRLTEHREGGQAGMPRTERASRLRATTERAILELSGERGYANFTIADLMARSGSNRSRFYSSWQGKEDCFVSAHAAAADEFLGRLLAVCGAASDWDSGVAAALIELDAFTAEAPGVAAGLIGEVHAADAALEKRGEVFDRLSCALDKGREGVAVSRHLPPASTSALVLNAVEASVVRCLRDRDRLSDVLPELLYFILVYYREPGQAHRAAARLAAGQS
jgi:AcrR family transcriptional regulator